MLVLNASPILFQVVFGHEVSISQTSAIFKSWKVYSEAISHLIIRKVPKSKKRLKSDNDWFET